MSPQIILYFYIFYNSENLFYNLGMNEVSQQNTESNSLQNSINNYTELNFVDSNDYYDYFCRYMESEAAKIKENITESENNTMSNITADITDLDDDIETFDFKLNSHNIETLLAECEININYEDINQFLQTEISEIPFEVESIDLIDTNDSILQDFIFPQNDFPLQSHAILRELSIDVPSYSDNPNSIFIDKNNTASDITGDVYLLTNENFNIIRDANGPIPFELCRTFVQKNAIKVSQNEKFIQESNFNIETQVSLETLNAPMPIYFPQNLIFDADIEEDSIIIQPKLYPASFYENNYEFDIIMNELNILISKNTSSIGSTRIIAIQTFLSKISFRYCSSFNINSILSLKNEILRHDTEGMLEFFCKEIYLYFKNDEFCDNSWHIEIRSRCSFYLNVLLFSIFKLQHEKKNFDTSEYQNEKDIEINNFCKLNSCLLQIMKICLIIRYCFYELLFNNPTSNCFLKNGYYFLVVDFNKFIFAIYYKACVSKQTTRDNFNELYDILTYINIKNKETLDIYTGKLLKEKKHCYRRHDFINAVYNNL